VANCITEKLINIPLVGIDGTPTMLEKTAAIYEQDSDLLFKAPLFVGPQTGRGRELVIRSMFSGFVYLWIFDWIFRQDASVEVRITISGRDLFDIRQEGGMWGQLITKNRYAVNHLHSYNMRFDFDLDNGPNRICETNLLAVPVDGNVPPVDRLNACGQGVDFSETVLETELQAVRNLNMATNRSWTVTNESSKNRLGQAVGYALLPTGIPNGISLASDQSWAHRHFVMLQNQLFVTKFRENERFAAGEFPILQAEETGLGSYIQNDDNIVDKDIVVWYNANFPHATATEDFRFLSTADSIGVRLQPHNFFERSVGDSIKPLEPCCSCDIICCDNSDCD